MTNNLHFCVYLECRSLNRRIYGNQKRFRTENSERKTQYMLYLCVKGSQLDAQFIVSIVHQKPLHVSDISTVHYQEVHRIFETVGIYCFFGWLSVVNIWCSSWWWSVDTSETCRGIWWNILTINYSSSWFSFTHIYRDAGSTKHLKKCIVFFYLYVWKSWRLSR
jgi:hypothetical protein